MMNAIFAMRSRAQGGARQYLLVTLLATLLLAAVPQARAEEDSSRRVVGPSEAGLPFKAMFTTTLSTTVDPSRCPEVVQNNEGSGLASQLGTFTVVQTSCLIPSQDPLAFRDGHFVFTAADGATLRGHYGGRVVPTPTSSQDDQLLIDAAWSISGGTGRFRGARGGGSGSGLLSPSAAEARVVLDGNIRLPSKR